MPRAPRPSPTSLLTGFALLLAGAASPAGAASISGVCPDGSIFIVQDRNRIPCQEAKEVAPGKIPPLRPEYLPRPYSWQVYRETANPNNPYNLIDAARKVRELQGAPPVFGAVSEAPVRPSNGPGPNGLGATALAPQSFAQAPSRPTIALSSDEIRDLFLIVELSQGDAPARFVKEDASGEATLEVSFAWSAAFEARVRRSDPELQGPVVLFSALAHRPDRFVPNLMFVQGHETFRPRRDDPLQMQLLEGSAGDLRAEGVVLGYVVLPERMDPGRDLDVYWNDRRLGTVLRP